MNWLISLIHPDDIPILDREYSDFIEGRKPNYDVEIRMKHKSGKWVYVTGLSKAVTRNPDGKVTRIVGVMLDITERKNAEQQLKSTMVDLERSNTDLEQFAYVASHDLREPLRMVSSYVQLLRKRYAKKLDESGHDFINFAEDGALRMQKMLDDLLAYSRVSRKGNPFHLTNCNDILNKVLFNLKLVVEENNTKIISENLPDILADETQMIQLFQNLISNSIKYRSEKPPKIEISAKLENKNWQFSFKDNGIGFADEHRNSVFEIFRRLHAKDEYSGSGIGLSIAKKIVERHGGKIWVDSEPGKGSTFYFTIPKNNSITDSSLTKE